MNAEGMLNHVQIQTSRYTTDWRHTGTKTNAVRLSKSCGEQNELFLNCLQAPSESRTGALNAPNIFLFFGLFLHEDLSILTLMYCHTDSRMASLTEVTTLLWFTECSHQSGQPEHHGLLQNFAEALPLRRALSALLHTPQAGWDTSQPAACKPAPTFQLFLPTQGSWQVHKGIQELLKRAPRKQEGNSLDRLMTNILFCRTVLHFLKNWVHKLKLPPGVTSIYSSDLHRPQWPWQSYKDHIFTWMNCSWTISPNRISINVRHTSLFILLPFPWLNISTVDIKEKKTSVHQHADSVKSNQSVPELNQCLQLSHSSLQLSHPHCWTLCPSAHPGDLLWKFIRTGFILQQPCSQTALEHYVINMIHMWIISITLTNSDRR